MSEGESFLARWSRLKREQAATPTGNDAQPPAPPPPVDAPPPSVDLPRLPPIESMGSGYDISAYLRAGVPLELAQEALRNAWRTDPAVRDFIEIADNQWDFNTPEAIPGFGPLGAVQEAKALVARATGAAENTAATIGSQKPGSDQPDSRVMTGMSLEDSSVVDPVWQAGTIPVAKVEPASSRRLHGSALPK
jgi:Protein of unknown function (DUF3306)